MNNIDDIPIPNQYSEDQLSVLHTQSELIAQIPTIDSEVRQVLQILKEPQTHYGEDNADRRDRLVQLVTKNENIRNRFIQLIDGGFNSNDQDEHAEEDEDEDFDEEFYTPGDEDLYNTRIEIADYSLHKARLRLENQRKLARQDFVDILQDRRNFNDNLTKFELQGSQLVSNRLTSLIRINPLDSSIVACGSWDGKTYLMDEDLNNFKVLKGHDEKIGGIDWNPLTQSVIATSGGEGLINIYNISSTGDKFVNPSCVLRGHQNRVTRINFHPNGKYLSSASFDLTWRFWDIEKQKELYYQEGHSKEVFTLDTHPDGSLIASGGLDGVAKIWDLRTGKNIANFNKNGHIKGIHAVKWRLNGYELLTGGADSNLKLWDLRYSESCKNDIMAHSSIISDLRLGSNDKFMVSCSYDGFLNIIDCDSWNIVKKFKNNERFMSCDVSSDLEKIVAGGWDRSVKLYTK